MHYIQPCGADWTQQGRSECKLARNRFVQNKLQHWAAWADNRKDGAKSEPCIGLTASPLSVAPIASTLCGSRRLHSMWLTASPLSVAPIASTLCGSRRLHSMWLTASPLSVVLALSLYAAHGVSTLCGPSAFTLCGSRRLHSLWS
jgi:hypothetical protein